jgi:hypothetical protein
MWTEETIAYSKIQLIEIFGTMQYIARQRVFIVIFHKRSRIIKRDWKGIREKGGKELKAQRNKGKEQGSR